MVGLGQVEAARGPGQQADAETIITPDNKTRAYTTPWPLPDGRILWTRWDYINRPVIPTLGLWTVTPRHIVFSDTVEAVPEIRVVSENGSGLNRLPRRDGRLVRPNRGAELVCRLPSVMDDLSPVAVLRGSGGEVRRARLDPEAHFSGLLPGRWVLEVEAGGVVVERRTAGPCVVNLT